MLTLGSFSLVLVLNTQEHSEKEPFTLHHNRNSPRQTTSDIPSKRAAPDGYDARPDHDGARAVRAGPLQAIRLRVRRLALECAG